MSVCHLHVYSQYSVVHGLLHPKALIELAKQANMPAIALTDRMTMYAWVKFYQAAQAAGIKPILGAEVRVCYGDDEIEYVTLLCQSNVGYRRLSVLLSEAYASPHPQHGPCVMHDRLVDSEAVEDLLLLLGGPTSRWPAWIEAGCAGQVHQAIRDAFPDRFYWVLQPNCSSNEWILDWAKKHDEPVVATHPICFAQTTDFEAHEARMCIDQGCVLDDPKRPRFFTQDNYFWSPEQLGEVFQHVPSALTNTALIAKRCTVTAEMGAVHLPDYPTPAGQSMADFFKTHAHEALTQRIPDASLAYRERLDHEIDVITQMNFAGYFLIVADFINWAKQHDVPVGPGRGSGAGSLVAYVLGITDLDPLPYHLLFERFLNPERVSMPDFDIDFCMEKRDQVIQYVVSRYGQANVAQIITYGTMAARAVVRDVGRVLNHRYGFVDELAKLIPFELGMTLTKALTLEPLLQARYQQEESVKRLLDLALALEGVVRHVGKHAGGVVIAPKPLTYFTPLYFESEHAQGITQLDKDDLETIGLIKFDFLGLRTLTIIDWTIEGIVDQQGGEKLAINRIPLDDEPTYQTIKRCQTTAVFQLESRGMKELVKRLQPDQFEDLVALVALFRPGPLQSGMVDDFVLRKHGQAAIVYDHPLLESILQPTYGVILYQEQVMQIAQVLAGYTLGSADLLRRAMGKKKPEEMEKQRSIFMAGAEKKGIDVDCARQIFDLMEKFAGYGFNKSHSAAYALLSYQTAWLKTHYPAFFMAAVLSSDMDNTDKLEGFVQECRAMKLTLIPPQVNQSRFRFFVNEQGEIVFGLGAIKGIGRPVAEQIVSVRKEGGPFKDLFDFCMRLGLGVLNRRSLEVLANSGALDALAPNRATLLASWAQCSKHAEQQLKSRACGQQSLFGQSEVNQPTYPTQHPDHPLTCLAQEYSALGFYLTQHPFYFLRPQLNAFGVKPIVHVLKAKGALRVAGLVQQVRFMHNKQGKPFAFVSLSDESGQCEVTLYSEVLTACRPLLVKDQWVCCEGHAREDSYAGRQRLQVDTVMSFQQMCEQMGQRLVLRVDSNTSREAVVEALQSHKDPSGWTLVLQYHHTEGDVWITCGDAWRVTRDWQRLHRMAQQHALDMRVVS